MTNLIDACWRDGDGTGPDGVSFTVEHWPTPEFAAAIGSDSPALIPRFHLVVHAQVGPDADREFVSKAPLMFGGAFELDADSVRLLYNKLGAWILEHEISTDPKQRERAANIARLRRLVAEGPPRENLRARQLAEVVPQLLEVADRLAQIIDEAARALETGRPEGKVLAPVLRKALAFLWPTGVK